MSRRSKQLQKEELQWISETVEGPWYSLVVESDEEMIKNEDAIISLGGQLEKDSYISAGKGQWLIVWTNGPSPGEVKSWRDLNQLIADC